MMRSLRGSWVGGGLIGCCFTLVLLTVILSLSQTRVRGTRTSEALRTTWTLLGETKDRFQIPESSSLKRTSR